MPGKSKQKNTTPSSSDFQPPALKSKQKSTTSSSRDSKPSLPTTKDKKTKTVVPPEPSVEDEDGTEDEVEGDFPGSGDEEEEDSEEESDSDDDGVDQEGMERLVKLLGEDGLDEFDRAQLRSMGGEEDEDEDEDESGEEGESGDEEKVDENEDEISDEDEEDEVSLVKPTSTDEEDQDEDEQDDAIPLDEIESIIDEDAVPKQKLEIDNQVALERIRQTIQLDPSLPWTETLVVTYPQKIEVDVNDDLNRELAFYKQALHSAQSAHGLSIKHKFPFTRPSDYFAEMVKSDSHMERIRQRHLRLERKDMLDNSKGSKNDEGGDDFDVAVEDAISDRPSKRNKSSSSSSQNNTKGRMPRQARDKKFGFGGAGRRSKQNTKESTDDFSFGGGRGKKGSGGGAKGGKNKRPGKARRMTARSK